MAKIKDGSTYLGRHLCANDYYSEHESVRGVWVGKGAERLGLREEIAAGDLAFENLRCNRMPDGSGKLTPRDAADRVCFFDFQCSAPKSVSIMAVTIGDDRLLVAHDAAARTAFAELEKFAACQCNTRFLRQHEITGNVAAAAFRHTASRALDAQVHTHFVTANATWDGKSWKALTEIEMVRAVRYAGKVYQNELAARCLRLGYGVTEARDDKGTVTGFEIAGVSEDVRERFSKRRAEIEEGIAKFFRERGREPTAREIHVITTDTRNAKLAEITTPEVLRRQREQLSPSEWSALQSLKATAEQAQLVKQVLPMERESLRMAVSHLYERRSVAMGHEVLAEALNQNLGKLDLERLTKLLEKSRLVVLSENQRCPLLAAEYATARGVALEKWAVGFVNGRMGTCPPLTRDVSISEKLSDEQRRAVEQVLANCDQVMSLRGAAGVGKTTVIREIDQTLRREGRECWYCAPTSSAAETLRQEGMRKATTVADFLLNVARKKSLRGAVFVIDEAGLACNKQGAELLRLADANGARVIFVGDSRQHTSVEAGDFIRVLETHSNIAKAEIATIRRQTVPAYRDAVQHMAHGSVREGLEALDALGWIKEGKAGYLDAAAMDYLQHAEKGERVIAVTPSWEENRTLTTAIRDGLKQRGMLQGEREFSTLEPLQWTAAQKEVMKNYSQGMVLVFNRKTKGFARGEAAEVLGIDGRRLAVRSTAGGGMIKMRPARDGYDVTRSQVKGFAAGDQLLVRANGAGFTNGELVSVQQIDGKQLHVSGKRILDTEKFRLFDHGYVVTSHKSQSKTTDHVVVAASRLDVKSAYVACSRGRVSCVLHTPDKSALLGRLPEGIRKAALDFLPTASPSANTPDRSAHWIKKVPSHALSAVQLLRLNPKALCIEAALRLGGMALKWWNDQHQVDSPSLVKTHIEHE